jgi:hypothetical protein
MSEPTIVTGEAVNVARIMAVRSGMIIQIDTGMSHSKLSLLKVAQQSGLTRHATYRGALKDVNRWLEEQGVPARWSRKYPRG